MHGLIDGWMNGSLLSCDIQEIFDAAVMEERASPSQNS